MESVPHKDVQDLNEDLRRCGFKQLRTKDDFKKSVTRSSCGVQLSYQDPAKAMWIIRRHSSENSHKIKAGWCLDTNNKVMPSKPKG